MVCNDGHWQFHGMHTCGRWYWPCRSVSSTMYVSSVSGQGER